jgi:hypothetical protein
MLSNVHQRLPLWFKERECSNELIILIILIKQKKFDFLFEFFLRCLKDDSAFFLF